VSFVRFIAPLRLLVVQNYMRNRLRRQQKSPAIIVAAGKIYILSWARRETNCSNTGYKGRDDRRYAWI
jgi:hypothetical protein